MLTSYTLVHSPPKNPHGLVHFRPSCGVHQHQIRLGCQQTLQLHLRLILLRQDHLVFQRSFQHQIRPPCLRQIRLPCLLPIPQESQHGCPAKSLCGAHQSGRHPLGTDGANQQVLQSGRRPLGMDGANQQAGVLNLLKSQLRSQSTLGTARGEERVLLIG